MDVSNDLMTIRFVDISVTEMPSATSKVGTIQDQCIAILTRYIYEEIVLQYLYSPILNLEFKGMKLGLIK